MCLLLIGNRVHPEYPLVVAANRDEYYHRPTQPAGFWNEHPALLAGRDLEKGGTWFGIDTTGRLAAVTNYREPPGPESGRRSRGFLVRDYLTGVETAAKYLAEVSDDLKAYDGFNLIAGDQDNLLFLSTYVKEPVVLGEGIHGISNGALDFPWPKVILGKARLEQLLRASAAPDQEELLELLADRNIPDITSKPASDPDPETERMLVPIFVHGENFGTRSSTILICDRRGRIRFIEKSFDEEGNATGMLIFEFDVEK